MAFSSPSTPAMVTSCGARCADRSQTLVHDHRSATGRRSGGCHRQQWLGVRRPWLCVGIRPRHRCLALALLHGAGDPKLGFEHPELKWAAKTWSPQSDWVTGGGGTVWDGMAYDPQLNLLYFGTANSNPYPNWFRSPGNSDNLFLASILALDPDTGRLKWHYQATPGEMWDYDATQPMVLADLRLQGRSRKVLMQANKNGFFYVLDRATGKLLSAKDYVYVNWASRVDLKTGRPVLTGQGWYKDEPKLIFPAQTGGHNWMPMSYDPQTGLVYIPTIDTPMLFTAAPSYQFHIGEFNMGAGGAFPPVDKKYLDPKHPAEMREQLTAWDPVAQREVWKVPLGGFFNGGVLSTAGGLVFQGTSADISSPTMLALAIRCGISSSARASWRRLPPTR